MRQQQVRLDNDRDHDYNRDPYFYTAPTYRYNRGGSYYETNQYGADLLRRSVNYGYEEGFRTGEADRQDRWRSDYRDSYAYQDANYGYTGYYVDQDEYNYYFRQGSSRGYEDGFSSRNDYPSAHSGPFADCRASQQATCTHSQAMAHEAETTATMPQLWFAVLVLLAMVDSSSLLPSAIAENKSPNLKSDTAAFGGRSAPEPRSISTTCGNARI